VVERQVKIFQVPGSNLLLLFLFFIETAKPSQAKPSQPNSSQPKSSQPKPTQADPSQAIPSQVLGLVVTKETKITNVREFLSEKFICFRFSIQIFFFFLLNTSQAKPTQFTQTKTQ